MWRNGIAHSLCFSSVFLVDQGLQPVKNPKDIQAWVAE